jgi:type II secretory pathway component PulF
MLVRRIPGVGTIREKFALARFFSTLDAQLEAQVNIWDAFANAARTTDSGRMIAAARGVLPRLQRGESLADALSAHKMIPGDYLRQLRVAEQTGELDAELTRLTQESEELAMLALARWADWLPRIIYVLMLCYGGWQIVNWYSGYLTAAKNFDPFGQ